MKRGDIVIAAAPGEFTGKPRPYVVVQSDRMLEASPTVTVCPLTTHLIGIGRIRVAISAEPGTGLEAASEIEIDRVTTMRRTRIASTVGRVPSTLIPAIDTALRRWLDL